MGLSAFMALLSPCPRGTAKQQSLLVVLSFPAGRPECMTRCLRCLLCSHRMRNHGGCRYSTRSCAKPKCSPGEHPSLLTFAHNLLIFCWRPHSKSLPHFAFPCFAGHPSLSPLRIGLPEQTRHCATDYAPGIPLFGLNFLCNLLISSWRPYS